MRGDHFLWSMGGSFFWPNNGIFCGLFTFKVLSIAGSFLLASFLIVSVSVGSSNVDSPTIFVLASYYVWELE